MKHIARSTAVIAIILLTMFSSIHAQDTKQKGARRGTVSFINILDVESISQVVNYEDPDVTLVCNDAGISRNADTINTILNKLRQAHYSFICINSNGAISGKNVISIQIVVEKK